MLQNVPWAGWGGGCKITSKWELLHLPGESQGQWSLMGCRLWGCRVGHDWSNLAAALNEKSDVQRLSSFPKVIRLAGSRDRIWTKVCLHQNQVFASLSCCLSKEGRIPKNWCLRMLEKIPESPLDSKEIKPVSLKGVQPWIFTGNSLGQQGDQTSQS